MSKKIDLKLFYEGIEDGMSYDELVEMFTIKTKEQFKRFLYDVSIMKNELIKFDFSIQKRECAGVCVKDGCLKLRKDDVQEFFKTIGAKQSEMKPNIKYNVENKMIEISVL